VACGDNGKGQCDIPVPGDVKYTQVAAGSCHTVLLKEDGTVVAFGWNDQRQCDIPAPEEVRCTQVAAGVGHTVLLKEDGTAVACGARRCNIPAPGDVKYTQVAAGSYHTVLLKEDGTVVACGDNDYGQCNIYAGAYVANPAMVPVRKEKIVVQVSAECPSDEVMVVTCSNIGNETLATVACGPQETAGALRTKIADALDKAAAALQIILPSGEQLDEAVQVPLRELFGLVDA